MKENDYNIAVSSYVEKKDTREVINITELNAEIKSIVARQNELRTAIDEIVAEELRANMNKPMNRIEKLIEGLCPEGVEFKDVGTLIEDKTVTTVTPPQKLTKKHYKPTGTFPIVDQGQKFIVGYTDDSNAVVAKDLYVIFGDHTEAIKYVNFAFAQGADGIKV